MTYTVMGETTYHNSASFDGVNFDYDYPEGLNLDPKSDFHNELRTKIWNRASDSRRIMSKRYPSWQEVDKTLTTYIPTSIVEKELKQKDSRKPVSIVFPYSYSNLESLLTYMVTAFFQDPMFQYEGVEDDDVIGSMLMELVIRLQCIKNKVALALHTVLRNNFCYGLGPGIPYWTKRYGKVPIKSPIIREDELGQTSTEQVVTYIDGLIFEGNALSAVDPYLWLPDPAVSSSEIQDGEFVGWMDRDNYMNMLSEESTNKDIFNVRYLKKCLSGKSSLAIDESKREEKFGRSNKSPLDVIGTNHPIDNINMYITLIPKEWKLGTSEYPEKWFFRLSADSVITQCFRADHYHGLYPAAVASSEYDGYTSTPISRLEILSGLQGVLDFLFNCYDDKTEVLTNIGWLKIKDAKKINASVATVDPKTGSMWFEEPKQWFEYDYDGDLKLFESKRYSLAVTPNHNIYGRYRHDSVTQFKEAALINERSEWDEFKIPTSVYFSGNHTTIHIPMSKRQGSSGRLPKSKDIEIDSYIMAGFLGWFLSDGSISRGKSSGTYVVSIKQSKEHNFKEIDYFMSKMPYHVGKYHDRKKNSWQWTITDKSLYTWLKDNCYYGGTTGEYKEIPDVIRNSDRLTLKRLFDSFVSGDGHIINNHDNLIQIGTESYQLANDLQEIAIKIGYSCSMRDSTTSSGKPFWVLNVNKDAPWATITNKNTTDMRYKGKVYCFENSTHLTVVRRSGKAVLCGQSHITNVRKAVNDMFVVDPYLINIKDMTNEDGKEGKLIRLRRPAWGHGVKDVVQQLQVNDVTRANIGDASYITQWMDRIANTDPSMSGALRTGGPERLTRSEFQGTRGSAVTRLQRVAMIIGMQFMQDIGTMFAVNTQQYMTKETFVRITGRNEEKLMAQFGKERIPVSPLDMGVNYDLIVRDGSIPGGNFSESWVELFGIIAKQPELYQQFDLTRIFTYIATQLGAKNIEDFKRNVGRIQPTQMSDEVALREAERGNLVPIGDV